MQEEIYMPARTPEEVHVLFAEYFSAGDLEGIVSLYEPDATFLPQPGRSVSGTSAIREALKGFLALNGDLKMQPARVLQANDAALLFSKWTLRGTGPDGNAVELAGQTSDIVRRQADGTWLMVIDNPYGAEGVAA
jgi:uncharacterized protein (TIGR02246 family)